MAERPVEGGGINKGVRWRGPDDSLERSCFWVSAANCNPGDGNEGLVGDEASSIYAPDRTRFVDSRSIYY